MIWPVTKGSIIPPYIYQDKLASWRRTRTRSGKYSPRELCSESYTPLGRLYIPREVDLADRTRGAQRSVSAMLIQISISNADSASASALASASAYQHQHQHHKHHHDYKNYHHHHRTISIFATTLLIIKIMIKVFSIDYLHHFANHLNNHLNNDKNHQDNDKNLQYPLPPATGPVGNIDGVKEAMKAAIRDKPELMAG